MNTALRPAGRAPRWLRVQLVLVGVAASCAGADLTWPAIDREAKPWSRWWWLGNILEEDALRSEMAKYAEAGLGGLEITPIYGVQGYEDRFIDYLSPAFVERLSFVLREAGRLDLGIDIATGNGWPFGGPWVDDETACNYLAHKSWTLAGGTRLNEPVRLIETPLVRVAGPRRVDVSELVLPVSANRNLQDLALDQVRFERPLPLVSLMAFPENGGVHDLTSRVGSDGMLDWQAPAGSWTLHALFQGWHGKMVERAGPGGEGNVIDHFSSAALERYLARFDEALGAEGARGLRGYFNDSYEVDDASGESDWTPRFLDEFQARRKYDLRQHLPALFGRGASDERSRVLSDYRETISDLLLEEFTIPWRKWANARGALTRNQAHGSPANILDLYAASDIPEQEGTDLLAMKLASSAAHVTGKRLASAETATWINEHFLGTLGEVKAAVDLFLLGGINHNCYHGTAFSPPDEPWPGFHFYASIELNPSNPLWRDFPVLNSYVARAQSFLQSGKPDEDVLLYFNIHDRWAEPGDGAMPHFHGRSRERMDSWRRAAGSLRSAGYGFDAFSDRMLEGVAFTDGALQSSGGARYRAIVLPETRLIPLESMTRIFELAEAGATIVMEKALPSDVPGLGRLFSRRTEFQVYLEALRRSGRNADGVTTLPWGRGQILLGDDVADLLSRAGVERERLVDHKLAYIRRASGDGAHYFIVNEGDDPFSGWLPLNAGAKDIALFDPMSGEAGRAAWRAAPDGGSEAFVQLRPRESVIVKTSSSPMTGAHASYWAAKGEAKPLRGPWAVRFVAGGPELPEAARIDSPASWTGFSGDAGKVFGGTGIYTVEFARPEGEADGWLLDLGKVAESARVRLNGREIAARIQPPWQVEIPTGDLRADNVLEIEVTNLAANRIADLDRRGVKWKKFYNTNMPARRGENRGPDGLFSAAKWETFPSGLLGPVTLTPLSTLDPTK